VATGAGQLYWVLIRARLRDRVCDRCGASLAKAIVVSAGEGTTLDEHGLSDTSVARLLAATELLTVRCDRCDATCEVGEPLVQRPEARVLVAEDMAQWSAHALEVYRSIVRVRLGDRTCPTCRSPLAEATVERAAGGSTLPEFDLDDDAAVAIVAWTQSLAVRCARCRGVTTV
jgi:hypothetical protein